MTRVGRSQSTPAASVAQPNPAFGPAVAADGREKTDNSRIAVSQYASRTVMRSSLRWPCQLRCSRIRSTASSIRSSGAVRAMRKKPSPLGPYIEPGEMTTAASSSTSSQKEVEV